MGSYGGAGGAVTLQLDSYVVTNTADMDINVSGAYSDGIEMQSVGGVGGQGGEADGIVGWATVGGDGGDGGTVSFENIADPSVIDIGGGDQAGISLQSVGGSGGQGGNAGAAGGWANVGGQGGAGGGVSLDGNVTVTQEDSSSNDIGISAVSIGGNGGTGGAVLVNGYLQVQTSGADSTGIFEQSVGGTGGGGGSLDALYGGQAGASGAGGAGREVDVNVELGSITTEGADSFGILAESTAGDSNSAGSAYALYTAIGAAAGGGNGNGGNVNVTTGGAPLSTNISTAGDQSAGIQALSVGGGGGDGATIAPFLSLAIGGGGGGAVDVQTNGGAITT